MKMIRNALVALALGLLASLPAQAQQSSPNWTFGYVPTPAEWNFWFAKKTDWPGSASCLVTGCVLSGPLITAASSATAAGFNLPPGAAPTTPNNGDVWTTTAGMFVQINGATVGPLASGSSPTLTAPVTITGSNASALAVGSNGATNPAFSVDTSTASSATGLNVKSAAAGAGVAVSVISSGANEGVTLNAKSAGTIGIGTVSTGNITIGNVSTAQTIFASVASVFTGAGTQSLVVGPNGTTNPTLQVDDSTASAATGLLVKSAAAAGGLAVSVISSGTNENLTVNAKGSGTISIGGVSTGTVNIGGGGGGLTVTNSFTATGLVTFADMATAAVATSSQYLSGASNVLVPASVIYTSETTTTFGATTTFDFSTFINTAVTLTGNITTQTLSNVTAGKSGHIRFIQDGTGSRTTVWNSIFKFAGGTTPTLTTTAGAIDVLFYDCASATLCYASLVQNMK